MHCDKQCTSEDVLPLMTHTKEEIIDICDILSDLKGMLFFKLMSGIFFRDIQCQTVAVFTSKDMRLTNTKKGIKHTCEDDQVSRVAGTSRVYE